MHFVMVNRVKTRFNLNLEIVYYILDPTMPRTF